MAIVVPEAGDAAAMLPADELEGGDDKIGCTRSAPACDEFMNYVSQV